MCVCVCVCVCVCACVCFSLALPLSHSLSFLQNEKRKIQNNLKRMSRIGANLTLLKT